jgi:hypothetical protein
LAPEVAPARLSRPVIGAHAVTLVAAFGVWAYLDRNLWFFGDEWDFLTRRGLHGATFSIWTPHNEHWSVLPILLWRAVFSVEHLSTYWPYLVPLLLAHVAVVHLLWRRCLREGAEPWVATALALLFALFGTGAEDLAWAFQIGFVGSLLLGLLALEVADGPRAPDGGAMLPSPLVRDAVAALLAVAALMCSDVGLATTVALGVVVLARYGWERAARTLAVPVAVYVFWFALAGHTGLGATGDRLTPAVFRAIPTFLASNLEMGLGHGAGWPAGGLVLAVAVMSWLLWNSRALFRRHPAVLGGALASIAFYVLAALGRDRISATDSPSRYAYIGIALLLPTIALMLSILPSWLRYGGERVIALTRASAWRRGAPSGSVAVAPAGAAPAGPPGGASSAPSLVIAVARIAVLVIVVLATAANFGYGLQFVRSRTVYVRGLREQIITSGALLQSREQMDRAINADPIWASGFASGYLTPGEIAKLYREQFLPTAGPALMTETEVREDESWLDVAPLHRRMFVGSFSLVSRSRSLRDIAATVTTSSLRLAARPGRRGSGSTPAGVGVAGWPVGPGRCEFASPPGARDRRGTVTFALAHRDASGSLWLSLGAAGGRAHFYLARAWGFGGPRRGGAFRAEMFQVPAKGDLWVNDSAPGDDLVLALRADQHAEICGLAGAARSAGAA